MKPWKIRARGHRDPHAAGGSLVETLETRRLFSMPATIGPYTLQGTLNYDSVVNDQDFIAIATNYGGVQPAVAQSPLLPLVAQSIGQPPPIKGTFTGSYTSGGKKFHMSLVVATHTHTGHFSGEASFGSPNGGNQPAQFSGKVTSALHVHIDFAGSGFSGTLTGATTHTGGQISGSFSVTGNVNGTGTYKVIKP